MNIRRLKELEQEVRWLRHLIVDTGWTDRPAHPYQGQSGYNSDLDQYEYWNGSAWVAAGGASVYKANKTILTTDWSLGATYYEATITDANISTTKSVSVIVTNASGADASAAGIQPELTLASGSLIIYATSVPANDIDVVLEIIG